MEPSVHREHRSEQATGIQTCVRVLLVDDSIFALQGLRTFLSKSGSIVVVGTASSDTEAIEAVQAYQPNVVVMEIRVGRASGIYLCRRIRESYRQTAVIFFTASDDKHFLHSAILAGAQGYLLKSASLETVAKSIEIVSAGQAIIDQELTNQVLTWVRDGKWAAQGKGIADLSVEDQRLLSFVAAGKTNKAIAQELKVPPSIMAARLRKIYKRIKITRKSEAAGYFVRLDKGSFEHTTVLH
jgi:two-component system response regulator DevR